MICPITNKKIDTGIANAIDDWNIFDGNFSSLCFILAFKMCISKAPIPSPENAIEIAIKETVP